ncbi:tetratricopeptide repeat protein [Myxococcota bacterium]|nr:tetratricopeptide repeat protein [Myxococcota bacterium]
MSSLGRTEAEALLGLGRALAQRGELAEAATLFDRAAAAWASSGREAERVRALVNRAHVAYLQGDFREALRRFDEVQDFRGDVRVRATMLTNRAVVEGLAGDPSATTAMLDEAIDLYRGAGEQALLANAIAARLWTLPEVDSGMRDAIKEAVAFCRRAGLAPVLGNLYWGLARAGGEDGSVRSVQSLARRAYRQYSRARMRVQMCAIRLFLARVLAVDDPPRALRHAERALADLPADLAATLRWQVSATQALVREAAGREEEAADWMARAREELTAVLRSYVAEGATPEERAVQWSRPRDLVRIDEVLA